MDIENRNPDHVQSLARGLAVLSAFSGANPTLTLSQVAENEGLTRATARRFLLTLVDLGYIQLAGKEFSLTPRSLEIGYAYLSGLGLTDIFSPLLAKLSASVGQSSSAAILDFNEVVYIARSAAQKIIQVQITIGTRFPAYSTALGRVLLAGNSDAHVSEVLHSSNIVPLTKYTRTNTAELLKEIELVRDQGFSFVDQELEIGLSAMSVPVRNGNGQVIAAINVAAASSAFGNDQSALIRNQLFETARSVEKILVEMRY